jgi:hypothetical protein
MGLSQISVRDYQYWLRMAPKRAVIIYLAAEAWNEASFAMLKRING